MKRINTVVSDDIYGKMLYLKAAKGITFGGIIMAGIEKLENGIEITEIIEKPKKREMDPRVIEDLENFRIGKGFCPVCDKIPPKCGCTEEQVIEKCMTAYGLVI